MWDFVHHLGLIVAKIVALVAAQNVKSIEMTLSLINSLNNAQLKNDY